MPYVDVNTSVVESDMPQYNSNGTHVDSDFSIVEVERYPIEYASYPAESALVHSE